MIPPPLHPPAGAPGTEEWARWHITNTFTDAVDQRAITDAVAAGLVPYVSYEVARLHYARFCAERAWCGWRARLAWACIEALLKGPFEDDIPF